MTLTPEQLNAIEEDDQRRYREYLICQDRGHQPSADGPALAPGKQTCRWCRTTFWKEDVVKESGAPRFGPSPEFVAALRESGSEDAA